MESSNSPHQIEDNWVAKDYSETVAPFVSELTETVVDWLNPLAGDDILDLGCGDGRLTARIGDRVHHIVGYDASPNMIAAFQSAHPHIDARVVDCRHLAQHISLVEGRFSKVFSNAALHWILRDESTRLGVLKACFAALRPGGTLVAELGAHGNVAEVHAMLIGELMHRGVSPGRAIAASPWWFPSLAAMRALAEQAGFKWIRAETELRQTVLTDGEGGGVAGWIKLFGAQFLKELKEHEIEDAVANIAAALEAVCRRQDGAFTLNYIRLRFIAQREA